MLTLPAYRAAPRPLLRDAWLSCIKLADCEHVEDLRTGAEAHLVGSLPLERGVRDSTVVLGDDDIQEFTYSDVVCPSGPDNMVFREERTDVSAMCPFCGRAWTVFNG